MKAARFALLLTLPVAFTSVLLAADSTAVRLRGEDTLILAAQRCSSLFKVENPHVSIDFEVAGGGPTKGMVALENGTADVVQTKSAHSGATLDHSGRRIVRIPIATEGIVVYVHDSNPIKALSLAELRAIYSGQIRNWKQLGGSDHPITRYSGESTSGINDFFQQVVLGGKEAEAFWGKASTKEFIDAVAQDKNAIGYSTLYPLAKGVHPVPIRKADGSLAVAPTWDNICKHDYPLTRTVYWYVAEHPSGSLRDFLAWIYMPHAQMVFESVGFFPLPSDERNAGLAILDGKLVRGSR